VSVAALTQLSGTMAELEQIGARVSELTAALQLEDTPLGPVKTELASLEARLHRLEATGVDNVYTGDLHSGRDDAKCMKKAMLARFEALFDTLEKAFSRIKGVECLGAGH